ncbi:MAG: alkyl hydroperoxide reductase [Alphaproteobacteria bacterium HGW-Alphaproteobacteria-5]|jgi:peroxiredoxin|nr:MAG: alkyl hydroperoxide reductase [Alphaproteobacteria bacterium HGW-Alphaproteobacteria-5]
MVSPHAAPPLVTSGWINSPAPLDIPDFAGRILVLHAFQMLCPGCVQQALPQAQRVAQAFPGDKVAVIGLHSVFEHHEAQGSREALAAFAHEYRLTFPIGIDLQDQRIPATMRAYDMQGTPTLVIVDRAGLRRFQRFGHVDDLTLGGVIGSLLAEPIDTAPASEGASGGCGDEGCAIPPG